jgi:hypothetical protein
MIRATASVIFVIAMSQIAAATSIVAVLTPEGVAITADSKRHGAGPDGDGPATKVIVIKQRVAVAAAGLGDVNRRVGNGDRWFRYGFLDICARLEAQAPANPTVSDTAQVLALNLRELFVDPAPLFDHGIISKEKHPTGRLIEFIVTGIDNGVPSLWRVDAVIDFDAKTISPKLNPRPFYGEVSFFGLGTTVAFDEVMTSKGSLLRRVSDLASVEFTKLRMRQKPLSLKEWFALQLAATRIEAEEQPEIVGGPYMQVLIPVKGTLRQVQIK